MLQGIPAAHCRLPLRKLYASGGARLRCPSGGEGWFDWSGALRQLSRSTRRDRGLGEKVGALFCGVQVIEIVAIREARAAEVAEAPGPSLARSASRLRGRAYVKSAPRSSVQSTSISGDNESRTEQYFVAASSIARSAWSLSMPAPARRKLSVMCR